MFTKDELQVIRAVLSNADIKGIQAAALIVALFHKVEVLISQPEGKIPSGSNDSPDSSQPHTDAAA